MGFTIDPSLPQVGQAQEGALMSIKALHPAAPGGCELLGGGGCGAAGDRRALGVFQALSASQLITPSRR